MNWESVFKVLIVVVSSVFVSFSNNQNIPDATIDKNKQYEQPAITETIKDMNIIIANDDFEVELENNATSSELLRRLPLQIEMHDLNENEKFYNFSEPFPINEEVISEIRSGDVLLYGDRCLVIFYKDLVSNYEYTRIGRIKDVDKLKTMVGKGSVIVEIKI